MIKMDQMREFFFVAQENNNFDQFLDSSNVHVILNIFRIESQK